MQSYEAGELMEVNTRVLKESADEFKHEEIFVQHMQMDLWEIQHRLRTLSGMDGIVRALKKEEHRLEHITMTLRQMGIALESISERYEFTEEAIMEHSEVIILYGYFSKTIRPIHKLAFANEIHSLRNERRYLNLINLMRK